MKRFLLPLLYTSACYAQTYTWDFADNIGVVNDRNGTSHTSVSDALGGSVTDLTSSYDADNEIFTWNATFCPIPEWRASSTPAAALPDGNRLPDAYTLIVNAGQGIPTSNLADEVVQLNVDFTNILNPLLTAYTYMPGGSEHDGTLLIGANDTSDIIQLDVNQIAPDKIRVELAISTAALNSIPIGPDWDGLQYDEEIGVWFHYFTGSTIAYDSSGALTQLTTPGGNGDTFWLDWDTMPTVPEPSSAILLFGASLSLLLKRRR